MKNKKLFILFIIADFIVFAVIAAVVVMKAKQPVEKPPAANPQQTQTVVTPETKKEATLYFYDKTMSRLVPHKMSLPSGMSEENERLQFCASQLLDGPPEESSLVATFPKDVNIKSIAAAGGTVTVDFNKNFLKPYGATQEIGMVGSLVLTLTDMPGVKNVQILCDGKKVPYLPEGTEIGHPLERSDFEEYEKNN